MPIYRLRIESGKMIPVIFHVRVANFIQRGHGTQRCHFEFAKRAGREGAPILTTGHCPVAFLFASRTRSIEGGCGNRARIAIVWVDR